MAKRFILLTFRPFLFYKINTINHNKDNGDGEKEQSPKNKPPITAVIRERIIGVIF